MCTYSWLVDLKINWISHLEYILPKMFAALSQGLAANGKLFCCCFLDQMLGNLRQPLVNTPEAFIEVGSALILSRRCRWLLSRCLLLAVGCLHQLPVWMFLCLLGLSKRAYKATLPYSSSSSFSSSLNA